MRVWILISIGLPIQTIIMIIIISLGTGRLLGGRTRWDCGALKQFGRIRFWVISMTRLLHTARIEHRCSVSLLIVFHFLQENFTSDKNISVCQCLHLRKHHISFLEGP